MRATLGITRVTKVIVVCIEIIIMLHIHDDLRWKEKKKEKKTGT